MAADFDTISIWLVAFIPMPSIQALGYCFAGDDRGFRQDYSESRYRLRSEITISGFLSDNPTSTEFHQCGETHRIDCATAEVLESATASTDDMNFHDFNVGNTFPDPEGGVLDNPNQFCVNVLYDGAAGNPLIVPSPDVDMNFFFTIDPVGRTVSFRGAVNGFPDYEGYVKVDEGEPIVLFQRAHFVDPIDGLPGNADQKVDGRVAV